MNCSVCGALLPDGAMFCGECGRATTGRFTPRAGQGQPDGAPMTIAPRDTVVIDREWLSAEFDSDPIMQPARERPTATTDSEPDAPQKRPPRTPTRSPWDVPAWPAMPGSFVAPSTADEADSRRTPWAQPQPPAPERHPEPAAVGPDDESQSADEVSAEEASAEEISANEVSATEAPTEEVDAPRGTAAASEPESVVSPVIEPAREQSQAPKPGRSAPPVGPTGATGAGTDLDDDEDLDDLERTRIVRRPHTGERFVLQFSTGESVMVFGTGVVGRNPLVQATEPLDQIITISDPSKSVSKTHLEFGQDQGAFWVNDRFSANGTIVREPESAARRCEPGRRYRIVRGTRVDIGEQFFIVS